MHQGKFVFSQILDQVVRYQFNRCVARYKGERWIKTFTCWEQFLALAFGQLSFRESLRDIAVCLTAQRSKLYHLGFRAPLVRTTLAHANEHRDWRIWRDYAQLLIGEARRLYADDQPFTLRLDGTAYVIDSTTIELCLHIFPWARLVKKRAAIKLHLELALAGNIPSFFDFSSGKEPDVFFLDRIVFEQGAYYILDRGYIDFARLHTIHRAGACFVTRAKDNLAFRRLYSHPVKKHAGVKADQTIVLAGYQARKDYPERLRRIKYYDAETDQCYVFLTNNFELDAKTIADLYKHRWQIELFFKWIKQHLRIKRFFGTSPNSVKTQIWIAVAIYVLIGIIKKKLALKQSLYTILQILSVTLFEKVPILSLFENCDDASELDDSGKQLNLFHY